MKTTNAIKKLEKNGYKVEVIDGRVKADNGSKYLIEFIDQRGEAICIGSRRKGDVSDSMTDYCATIFYDNISQVIRANA